MQMIRNVSTWLTVEKQTKYGLILSGGVGLGKTTMLRAIAGVVRYVTQETKGEDEQTIKPCILTAVKIMKEAKEQPDLYDKACRTRLLAIDDLGAEESKAKVYGNDLMPIVDLLQERYELRLPTIISTNLSYNPTKGCDDPENIDITRKYGERIVDRLRQYSFLSFGFNALSKRYNN